MDAVQPDVVVTFGADGITGHPDHQAVHRWTTEAWRRHGHDHVELLYASMTDDFLDRYRGLHDRIGVFGDHEPLGVPAEQVAFAVDLDDRELDRKRRALAAHASQTVDLAAAMGEATYRTWWSTESFRRA
jgi:LmbE family N-acetylglucosaminyl deacetylase